MYRNLLIVLLLTPGICWSAQAGDGSLESPLQASERAAAEESPLELGTLEVSSEGFSYDQEVALRIVRQAYGRPRSERQEDRDKWVCWLEKKTGSHFTYLGCARNGDIWALRPDPMMRDLAPRRTAGYGKIMVSSRPVNRGKLEAMLKSLPGSAEFDQEFISRVLRGEKPPRDIPDERELDQFASAWQEVERLHRRGRPETAQIRAIEKAGLSLKRYNRIAELVEIYQSIENQVAERLGM